MILHGVVAYLAGLWFGPFLSQFPLSLLGALLSFCLVLTWLEQRGSLPVLERAIQDKERQLDGTGRILVRYSGTEPVLRVMVEGQDERVIQEIAEDLVNVVKSCIH